MENEMTNGALARETSESPRETQERRFREALARQLGPALLAELAKAGTTDLLVNHDGRLWAEAHGKGLWDTGCAMAETRREAVINTAAAALGMVANADNPIVEGELTINEIRVRFEGILRPVAASPCFAIRKPAQVLYTLDDYVRDGILGRGHAAVLREAAERRLNVLIAGGTGSGKTTLAGALINEMVRRGDAGERFVILEDTFEIQCRAENLIQLHTAEAADLTRLVRATMRLRPDRIVIGEVRGGEALALLKAWLTGHPGGVTTVHANGAKAALTRLSSLVQEAGVPPQPELIAETINLIAFIARTPAGRRVTELARLEGYSPHKGFVVAPAEVPS
jgi:type IV secretion system protein VirB11